MLQYPYYKDLSKFIERNPIINLPKKNITDIMLKVLINHISNESYIIFITYIIIVQLIIRVDIIIIY